MAVEDDARMFIQRVRANEYSNESQLRFAFQTILPQIIGFGEALDFASGAESFEMSDDGDRLFFDTHYGSVIFEFKFSFTGSQIRPTVQQLEAYCTQQLSQGATNIIAIASDVMNWQTYDVSFIDGKASLSKARNGSLHLGEGDLTDHRLQEFIQYIRRVVSGQQRQWTQNTVLASFGPGSKIYRTSELILQPIIQDVKMDSQFQGNLHALSELLTFEKKGRTSEKLLTNHLYLELFTRTLVLSSLENSIGSISNSVLLDSAELNARLNSEMVFQEDGFFDWISQEPWASRLNPLLDEMKLAISNFETPSCSEVLPYVYDSLTLEEPSNWFGQTRTPIDLARRIIYEMLDTLDETQTVLDPFCGTGTFVIEWSKIVFGQTKDIEKTSKLVFGIDINPAAVLIARSIWVETFFDEIQKLTLPCHVPIYNGDSLFRRNISNMDTSKLADISKTKVDAIVGNPPWAALSHLPDAPYKDYLHEAAADFGIREGSSSHHHQNISTPFILIASKMYLRKTGQFGFILPRDTINGRAHELFRRSAFRNSRARSSVVFSKILDLNKEIFETLPATVWFGKKSSMPQDFPIQAAIWPELFLGDEGPHQLTLYSISEKPPMSALLYEFETAPTPNNLQYSFRQGADVLPLPCFAVAIIAENDGVARVETSFYATNNSDVKHKSKDMKLTGHVESNLIFRFDSSMHLFPYCWRHDFGNLKPLLAAAPVLSDMTDKGETYYR
ncbi:MAG: N-6 DNA methylase, partial [Euryarchaeota archaeon]